MAEPTNLRRLPRPKPIYAGVRPYPWLRVHGAGHPHEGRPVEREARCGAVISRDGECCDRPFTQQEIDRTWLEGLGVDRPGALAAFVRDVPQDEQGRMYVPVHCPRCEQLSLEQSYRAPAAAAAPSGAWWSDVPAAPPPTTEDLFGGSMA